MALDAILFHIGEIRIEVQPRLEGHNPLYRVPIKVVFPNGNTLQTNIRYDADKRAFAELVTVDDLRSYWPAGLKIPGEKWESARLTASRVFSTYIPERVEIKEEALK